MAQPKRRSEELREQGLSEAWFVVRDKEGRTIVDITIADEDPVVAATRAVSLIRVAQADMEGRRRPVAVRDRFAGMEPDIPAPPVSLFGAGPERIAAALRRGRQMAAVPPSGDGSDAGTPSGGSSTTVDLETDGDGKVQDGMTVNCTILRTHGPHLWRKPEPGRPVGPLVQCPGMEVGPVGAFSAGRTAPPPAQARENGAGGTLRMMECHQDLPHAPHTWRGLKDGTEEKVRCPGVQAESEED